MGDDRVQDLKGRAKEAAGDLTGDRDLQRKGQTDQTKATVKGKVGNVVDALKDKLGKKR